MTTDPILTPARTPTRAASPETFPPGSETSLAPGAGHDQESRWASALAAGAIVGLVLAQFWPLLDGSFFLDDFVHLYDFANYGLAKLLLSAHGGHTKLVSNATFALLCTMFGLEPGRWFATVLALHVANALMLFVLLRRLECSRLIASATTALWALSPVQVGALGWFVTSGHVLVGLLTLVVLLSMQRTAALTTLVPAGRVAYWCMLGLAMALSYGIGVGIAAVLWLVSAAILPFGIRGRGRAVGMLASLLVIIPAVYAGVHALYGRLYDVSLFYPSPVFHAPLTAWVSAVAQCGRLAGDLLVYGLGVMLCGSLVYVATAGQGVAVGPWHGTPTDILVPALRLPAFGFLLLGLSALRGAPHRLRQAAVALTALVLSAYGIIAWGSVIAGRLIVMVDLFGGGVAAASTAQAVTARHHYAATILLAGLLAIVAETMARRSLRSRRVVHVVVLAAVISLALRQPSDRGLVRTAVQTGSVLSGYRQVLAEVERAAEQAKPGAAIYLENKALGAGFLQMKGDYFPGWAGVMAIFHPDGMVRGRTVRFIERDPHLLDLLRAQTNTPISRLVVSPDEVPPSLSGRDA